MCSLVASSSLISKLISAKELTGGNRTNPCSPVSFFQKSLHGLHEPHSPLSQPNCYTREAGGQTQLQDAICRNPEVSRCKPPQRRSSAACCQRHHWTSHGLPALWASHTHGYYVRSCAPTRVSLEVMGCLDCVQRIKESFERTLLFGRLYPVQTLNEDVPALLRGLRSQWS